jgi:hypothetical protein
VKLQPKQAYNMGFLLHFPRKCSLVSKSILIPLEGIGVALTRNLIGCDSRDSPDPKLLLLETLNLMPHEVVFSGNFGGE